MATVKTIDVLLKASTAGYEAGMKRASQSNAAFSASMKMVRTAAAGMAAYFSGRAVVGFIQDQARAINETSKMAKALGMGTEAFAGLQDGFEDFGVDIGQFENNTRKMRQSISDATTGGKEAAEAFGMLGISASDIVNLSADQQMMAIADAFQQAGVSVHTTAAAIKIFGRNATDMLPVLAQGRGGLQGMIDQAKQLGLAFDEVAGKKVRDAALAFDQIGDVFKGVGRTIAIELAPYLTALSNGFATAATAGDNMQGSIQGASSALGPIVTTLGTVGHVFYSVFKVFQAGVTTILDGIVRLVEGVASIEKLFPDSMQTGTADAITRFREELDAQVLKTGGELNQTWGDLLSGNTWGQQWEAAAETARQAARSAVNNAVGETPIELAATVKYEPPAALLKGTKEAASAYIAYQRNLNGMANPQVKLAAEQLRVQKEIARNTRQRPGPQLAVAGFNG